MYESISQLPDKVHHVLPKHAQEIYREAFNNALDQYQAKEKRRNKGEDPETIAHKVAWSAVKAKYQKNDQTGKWVAK